MDDRIQAVPDIQPEIKQVINPQVESLSPGIVAIKPGDRVVVKTLPKSIYSIIKSKEHKIVGYEEPLTATLGTVKKIRRKSARIDVVLDDLDAVTNQPVTVTVKSNSLMYIDKAGEKHLRKGEADAKKRREERDNELKKERTEKYGPSAADHITS